MVNDDVLIKIVRNRGHKYTWPEQVILMKERLRVMKLGFPGIGNNHISLIEFKDLKDEDLFIYDAYVETGENGDLAPIMMRFFPGKKKVRIEGIGCGWDLIRDPDRIKIRWQDILEAPELPEDFLVWRIDIRPTLNGGPGYYYFFKSYRDFRY